VSPPVFYFSIATSPSTLSPLPLHDALPISRSPAAQRLQVVELESPTTQVELDVEGEAGVAAGQHEAVAGIPVGVGGVVPHHLLRSEEHTSELQSRFDLVCRLLLEKQNIRRN